MNVSPGALVATVRRHLTGDFEVDPWGCDADAQDLVDVLLRQVIRVDVAGADHVPPAGPALLVANRRLGLLEPVALARAIRQAAGRRLRYVGLPDIPPVATPLRRLGTVVNRPDEVAGLLRAGHLVGLPLSMQPGSRTRAGTLMPDDVAPALAVGAPLIPVAVVGGELSGRWTVHVGGPVERPDARGPLALSELADAAERGVQALLDEAFPPHWPWD